MGGGNFHLIVDFRRPHIQRAAEDIGEAENVVHLVRIIGAAGGDDGVIADGGDLLGHDFRGWVGHRENNRPQRHRGDHFRREGAGHRQAEDNIGVDHGLFQAAVGGAHRMRRFPLIHAGFAALVNHPAGVADDHVFRRHAHRLDQFHAGDGRGAGAIDHHPRGGNIAARQMEGVNQTGRRDDRRSVLIVMKNRDVQQLF